MIALRLMSKEDAIQAAQAELARLGTEGTVVDVYRVGQRSKAIIVLSDGTELPVGGFAAIKLAAMLRSSYQRWRRYSG
jgi:hypothetical protein